MIKFSLSNNSFYSDEFEYSNIPSDVIEISDETHSGLLKALNTGCVIFPDLTYSEPKPSPFHVWYEGNLKWIDPRTDEEVLQHTRESMPKLNQREFRKLLRDNNLFDQAKAFIYSSGNGYLEDAWEYSEYFSRTDTLLVEAMRGLSLTDEQVDAIWLSVK